MSPLTVVDCTRKVINEKKILVKKVFCWKNALVQKKIVENMKVKIFFVKKQAQICSGFVKILLVFVSSRH